MRPSLTYRSILESWRIINIVTLPSISIAALRAKLKGLKQIGKT